MTSSDAGDAPGARLTDLVSVVVCAKDAAATIADTLQAIVANHPHEIIVVDDQSRDNTAEVARRFTERVLPSPGKGLAAARQFGVEQARCRYVSFVDSDVVLSEGCLQALATVLEEDPAVGCASATSRQMESESRWVRAGSEIGRIFYPFRAPGRTLGLGLRNSMFRRDLLLELAFDPFFVGAAEDQDLGIRLRNAGWHLHRSEALAYHYDRSTLWAVFKQRLWYGRGSERFWFKYGTRRTETSMRQNSPSARSLIARFVRERRFDLAVYMFTSALGFRLGRLLERIALRNTPYPGRGTPSRPS